MLELPSVTLFCADCVQIDRAVSIIERCKSVCNFGAVKLLTSLPTNYQHRVEIDPLPSLCDYSIFMLKRAHLFIDTPHMLVVQHDGFILNADSWNPEWLKYDYIGPFFIQHYPLIPESMGTGGFSFRSKALMEYVSKRVPEWDGSSEETARIQAKLCQYEDGVIAASLRHELINTGFRFAPHSEAAKFAQGGWPLENSLQQNDTSHYTPRPFGFHGAWRNVDFSTGFVSPPPFRTRG